MILLEDMTPETVCLCLAEGKDEFSFAVKAGRSISPPLHLLHVLDLDLEASRIKWQWYRPRSSSISNPRTRVMELSNLVEGFHAGKHPVTAWCDFFTDEFVYCWELEEGDNVGSIPKEFHTSILNNLSAILKAKCSAKKKAVSSGPAAATLSTSSQASTSAAGEASTSAE
ncbi:hypothetical protein CYMTET_46519 [Cymbomonas tetramitiformis]|uniref:Uncharacterized protein n=1 Tax=Cymbomonas tetramitiformis TaxID=36881 RepID=A0AAE0EXJ0_9CHLO|nr:hypothetical protein CYMTET_46519 [Cymbomonas tetramitiformis]